MECRGRGCPDLPFLIETLAWSHDGYVETARQGNVGDKIASVWVQKWWHFWTHDAGVVADLGATEAEKTKAVAGDWRRVSWDMRLWHRSSSSWILGCPSFETFTLGNVVQELVLAHQLLQVSCHHLVIVFSRRLLMLQDILASIFQNESSFFCTLFVFKSFFSHPPQSSTIFETRQLVCIDGIRLHGERDWDMAHTMLVTQQRTPRPTPFTSMKHPSLSALSSCLASSSSLTSKCHRLFSHHPTILPRHEGAQESHCRCAPSVPCKIHSIVPILAHLSVLLAVCSYPPYLIPQDRSLITHQLHNFTTITKSISEFVFGTIGSSSLITSSSLTRHMFVTTSLYHRSSQR